LIDSLTNVRRLKLLPNEQKDEKCDARDDAPEKIGAGYEKL
jgi:hypothetical protein